MEKGDFGKIKNAIKEVAHQNADRAGMDRPNSEHLHSAFDFLRISKRMNPNAFPHLINAMSKGHELRAKVGEQRYNLYTKVTNDIEAESQDVLTPKLEDISQDGHLSQDEKKERTLREVLATIDTTTQAVRNDPRLLEAFRGEEQLLNEVVTEQSALAKNFFQGLLEQSRNKSKLH